MVHWLGLCALTAKGLGLIPGQGTKILHAMQHEQKKKKRKKEKILELKNTISEFKTSLDALNMEMEMTEAESLRLEVYQQTLSNM